MIEIPETQDSLNLKLNTFIWDFKIGDNIIYNLNVIYRLVDDHNDGGRYCKPISILAVAVIEAILVDFVSRLHEATNHFPTNPNVRNQRIAIKARLKDETRIHQSIFEGEQFQYWRLRNFGFSDLVDICEEFRLLGVEGNAYTFLASLAKLRNRVHIKNYFGNFEKDESKVFTEPRAQQILDFMLWMFGYFEARYSRPW